jgi:hypothetical protein
MSATSREARTASAGGCDLSGPEHAELVEGAGHGAHRSGGNLGVEGGVVQLRVPEQDLDDADIKAVLEEMRGETVPQCVRSDPLGDLCRLCRIDDDAMELPGADRLHGVLSRKQPTVTMHHALLVPDLPPLAQQGEQIWTRGNAKQAGPTRRYAGIHSVGRVLQFIAAILLVLVTGATVHQLVTLRRSVAPRLGSAYTAAGLGCHAR